MQIDIFLWPWLATVWESRLYDARNPSTRRWWSCFRRQKSPEDGVPAIAPGIAISIRNLGKTFNYTAPEFSVSVVTVKT